MSHDSEDFGDACKNSLKSMLMVTFVPFVHLPFSWWASCCVWWSLGYTGAELPFTFIQLWALDHLITCLFMMPLTVNMFELRDELKKIRRHQ